MAAYRYLFLPMFLLAPLQAAFATDDHGDTADTATKIDAEGMEIRGTFNLRLSSQAPDTDWFRFETRKGVSYVISSPNALIFEADDPFGRNRMARRPTLPTQLVFTAKEDGMYYFSVRENRSRPFHDRAAAGDDYTVSVTAYLDDHGNSPEDGTRIEADGSIFQGSLAPHGDVDYFLFYAEPGKAYSFRPDPETSYHYRFDILDNNKREIKTPICNGIRSWRPLPNEGGLYTIRVHSPQLRNNYDYAFIFSAYEDDHGDRVDDATELDVNSGPVIGRNENTADADVFSFVAQPGRIYKLAHTKTPGTSLGLSVNLDSPFDQSHSHSRSVRRDERGHITISLPAGSPAIRVYITAQYGGPQKPLEFPCYENRTSSYSLDLRSVAP